MGSLFVFCPLIFLSLSLKITLIIKIDKNIQMHFQSFYLFVRTPGFSYQSVDIRSKHGAGMIECKQRIMSQLLQFALPDDTASSSFIAKMFSLWSILFYDIRIKTVLITLN